jgi:RNA 3'-terminal phosphate cyclase (ATP)
MAERMVRLDGSHGEGGGQILRSALTLSLLTGQAFRIEKIRANRDKPGLRPQHLTAVDAAASLCGAVTSPLSVGSREVVFRPEPYEPKDVTIDIGTAGSTALVLHTLFLPIALKATEPVRVVLIGGTFNDKAPSYPFLESTWKAHLARIGLPVGLALPLLPPGRRTP